MSILLPLYIFMSGLADASRVRDASARPCAYLFASSVVISSQVTPFSAMRTIM